jgi:hypothetical protein
MILREGSLEKDADVALRQKVLGARAVAGREVGDLLDLEAERRGVEERRLLGVGDLEPDVIDVDQSERIVGDGTASRGRRGDRGHRSCIAASTTPRS